MPLLCAIGRGAETLLWVRGRAAFLTSLQERQPRLRTPCMGVFFIYTFASKTDLHRYQAWGCVQPQVQIRDISENKRQYG